MTTSSDHPFGDVITSEDQLRQLYRPPMKVVAEKKLDRLQPWSRAVVEASRFVFIATSDSNGRATVSPKGGADGFVAVLDDRHLVVPDYAGNNLIDGLRNIVDNPSVGLIFVIPGRNDTLRVDGDAWVTTDPTALAACRPKGKRAPKSAIGVRIREVFYHCPSSFNRAGMWEASGWRDDAGVPFDDFIRASVPEEQWPDWARSDD